jgi:hypothetical protein
MHWIPCAQAGSDIALVGSFDSVTSLNGNAYTRGSLNKHQEIPLSWTLTTREAIRPLFDIARGMYGKGLIYWYDPFAAPHNALPFAWSVPSLAAEDGVILNGAESRPTLTPTGANSLGLPPQSAVYEVDEAEWVPEVWVPIPPGYTAHVGWVGDSSGGGEVQFYQTVGISVDTTPVTAPAIAMDDPAVTNATIASGGGVDGVLVKLGGTGTAVVTAITVRVVPNGSTPDAGFVAGLGHGGCDLVSITEERYSAIMDKIGANADFVETGGR